MVLPDNLQISCLEEIILTTLKNRVCYGLQIILIVKEVSYGEIDIKFGSLYPALNKLEKKGYLKGHWDEQRPIIRGNARRKYYTITEKGKKALAKANEFRQRLELCQSSTVDEAIM